MAYALISHVAAAGPNTFTTGSISTATASLVIVAVTELSAGAAALSDNKSNTWVSLTEQANPSPGARIYYAKNPTVGSGHTFTATGSSIYAVLSVAAFSGANTTSPFDQQNGTAGTGFGGAAQPGSITPGSANELVVSCFGWDSSATMSIDSGMTITDQTDYAGGNNFGGALAYIIQTSATAINPTWSFSGTEDGGVAIASFLVAAGGGVIDALEWRSPMIIPVAHFRRDIVVF